MLLPLVLGVGVLKDGELGLVLGVPGCAGALGTCVGPGLGRSLSPRSPRRLGPLGGYLSLVDVVDALAVT